MAFVLGAASPLEMWLSELAAQIDRAPAFIVGKPVVLDLAAVAPDDPGLESVVTTLQSWGIRLIGVEGIEYAPPGGEAMMQPLSYGRDTGLIELPEAPTPAPTPSFLLHDAPVRSGQTLAFPTGDITIVGSVASGAEVLAGGSIHVYGTLRGRAIAGAAGFSDARIFCRRLEAELLAIDGLYMTSDAIPDALRGRAAQAHLRGEAIIIEALA
jgi:septum site-determining protein MinC